MLKRLLHLVETANGPIHTQELSQQLGVSTTAVQGMLETLVRTGRLQKEGEASPASCAPPDGGCGGCHPGSCPLPVQLPPSYRPLRKQALDGSQTKRERI